MGYVVVENNKVSCFKESLCGYNDIYNDMQGV